MEKELEPSVEIQHDEPETPEAVSQVVPDDLPPVKPVEKPDDKPKPALQPRSDDATTKLQNTIAYQTRQLEKAMRELASTKEEIAALRKERSVPSTSQTQDEIDEIAQRDWKMGVKKVVEKDIEAKVQEIISKREQAMQEVQRRSAMESELEKSKQRVLDRYPEIEDSNTEESRLYRDVINEDNSLLSNIHGPEIAMYRMEEKLRLTGRVPSSVQPVINREAQRLARVGASSVVGRTAATKSLELSKDQKEFCKHHNIPEETYKQHLKASSFREGVEA